ncbi:BgTH12-03385 [Blumeria graminis f. sp. triticale]|uniref:BgTH12-03385 n=1 Tax=Blumeria graminis f. sp. triticale TaxID=1689686 RepID=A0A9W4D4H8_BLUGR|nr:BgTH12-03385 [Blumeria graminis f. sp. triticale]
MSHFPEIFAHLIANPIEEILTSFRNDYTEESAQDDVAALFATLAAHIQRIRPKNELRKLTSKFFAMSAEIMNNRNQLTELQSLLNAISQYQNDAEVFKIAIELAQGLADKPSGNQRDQRSERSDPSLLTPTPGPFTFTRSVSEAKDFNRNVTSMTAALRNELYKNVIVDLDNFWTEFFLGKDWSKQTWNIWKSYEAYELNEIKIQQEDTIMRQKMDALKIQKEAETGIQRETTNNKQKVIQAQKERIERISPNTRKITRSHKNKMAGNLETVIEEDTPKNFRKTRSQTKKEEGELAILVENESFEGSQNIGKTNTNDFQNQVNPKEAEFVLIQKISYKNKILTGDMTEDEMWEWLEFFREKFLNQLTDQFHRPSEKYPTIKKEAEGSQLRCQYFRSSGKCPMKGTNNDYQVDLLTKRIGVSNAHGKVHKWSDVRVLGEFTKIKSSSQRNEKFYQLSRLALQVFYTQPLRHFVHGFTAFQSNFELWVFNRSGAYSSGLFNIEDDKEKLVRAICSYLLMSEQELGIDSSIQKVNGRSSVSIYDENQKETRKFVINPKPFFMVGTIVTRGTTCFETSDKSKVVKYSWVRTPGKSEIDLLQLAHGVEGVAEYVTADVICTIGDHLRDLNFSNAKYLKMIGCNPFIFQAEGVEVPPTPQLRDRELRRIVITPRGRSLYFSKTIMEFLVGIRDAILAHRRLYVEKKILHGDISDGNIILATVDGKTQGMLIDFDHAEMVEPPPGKDDNLFLTGTMKFMALERLQSAANRDETIARTFHHDLESFFYVFIVGCITYEREKNSKEVIALQMWHTDNIGINYQAKQVAIFSFNERILDNFSTNFEVFKALASELRSILFGELGKGYRTPEDYGAEYEKIIEAFNNTIEDLRDGKIENKLLKKGAS